ncbi:MAG: hypothetical protein Q9M27_00400, partial [Mariprofundaceae bacterium]|nr:hypothetical protein [Mariprofundaceae bacterium]
MRIVCPHCQTVYQLDGVAEGAILVCHRCRTEFSYGQPEKDTEQETVKPLIPAEEMHADKHLASPSPPRARVRIMPWLLSIVLLTTVAGFWFNHDVWLDDPWLRSVLINTGLPLEVRDKDWRIQPGSVRAQWVKRNDGSRVLAIEGRVKNLLQCEITPPAIHFSIFSRDNPKHLLLERKLLISQPPLMSDIRHAPYVAPPEDRVPVSALGDRGFILLLEGLPENAGDFTLS